MTLVLVVTLALGGALEVSAPPGCVDQVEIGAALDEIGGIDFTEVVRVDITPRMDEYALVVDIALAQAAPLHREVPLRPRECQDVADLVAVLVQSQRRAALEARLLAEQHVDDPDAAPPKPALPAMDPRTRPVQYPGTVESYDGWTPCEGPAQCGGFRLALSMGLSYPLVGRGALDTGWDLAPNLTAIAQVDTHGGNGIMRIGGAAGLSWRTRVLDDVVELSLRGLVGGGGGTTAVAPLVSDEVQCVPDGSGGTVPVVKTIGTTRMVTSWYVAPTAALRARVGYLFAEVGTTWHLNLDATPNVYVAIGVAPFGG